MKCVCPMGGDRPCPDDCPVAKHENMSDAERKAQRKTLAKDMHTRGMTPERIAKELSIGLATVYRHLEFSHDEKIKHSKTVSNPKGAGRPKGSKKRRKNESVSAEAAAELILDGGQTYQQVETDTGLSNTVLRSAVAREEGRREIPPVDWKTIPATAQEKIQSEINRHKRKLDQEFEARCQDTIRRWLNDVSLPQYAKELAELERSITSRKGVMDRLTYRKILACLHPDRVQDPVLKKRFEEAFRLFTELEKRVLDEKQSPTEFRRYPRTVEELLKQGAAKRAENRARAAARKGNMTRRS